MSNMRTHVQIRCTCNHSYREFNFWLISRHVTLVWFAEMCTQVVCADQIVLARTYHHLASCVTEINRRISLSRRVQSKQLDWLEYQLYIKHRQLGILCQLYSGYESEMPCLSLGKICQNFGKRTQADQYYSARRNTVGAISRRSSTSSHDNVDHDVTNGIVDCDTNSPATNEIQSGRVLKTVQIVPESIAKPTAEPLNAWPSGPTSASCSKAEPESSCRTPPLNPVSKVRQSPLPVLNHEVNVMKLRNALKESLGGSGAGIKDGKIISLGEKPAAAAELAPLKMKLNRSLVTDIRPRAPSVSVRVRPSVSGPSRGPLPKPIRPALPGQSMAVSGASVPEIITKRLSNPKPIPLGFSPRRLNQSLANEVKPRVPSVSVRVQSIGISSTTNGPNLPHASPFAVVSPAPVITQSPVSPTPAIFEEDAIRSQPLHSALKLKFNSSIGSELKPRKASTYDNG